MEQRISAITLGVENLERSRTFYERLGWTPHPSSNEDIVFFQMNGFVLGLFDRQQLADEAANGESGSGFSGIALAYNGATREEVDRVLKLAESIGGTLISAAKKVFWGGYSGYFADLDGHRWEVAHNPFWTIDSSGHTHLPKK